MTTKNTKKKDSFKDRFMHFIDRRKHTTAENLRLAAVVPGILLVIGLFIPFLTVDVSVSVGSNKKEDIKIFDPESPALEVSLGDFITHKPLRQFKVFGQQLGEVQVLGINVYNLLTTPFPNLDKLNKLDESADGQVAKFLVNEDFVKFCRENLGEVGESIVQMGQVINEIAGPVREGLHSVTTVLNEMNDVSTELRNEINQAEGYLQLAGNILIVFVLIMAVAIFMFFIHKGPRYLPAIILSVFTFVFLAVGIGVAIANGSVSSALAVASQNINDAIRALLEGAELGAIAGIIDANNAQLNLMVNIFCNVGWWFTTISLAAITTLAYIVPSLKAKK